MPTWASARLEALEIDEPHSVFRALVISEISFIDVTSSNKAFCSESCLNESGYLLLVPLLGVLGVDLSEPRQNLDFDVGTICRICNRFQWI